MFLKGTILELLSYYKYTILLPLPADHSPCCKLGEYLDFMSFHEILNRGLGGFRILLAFSTELHAPPERKLVTSIRAQKYFTIQSDGACRD